jgi:hypothetical protein
MNGANGRFRAGRGDNANAADGEVSSPEPAASAAGGAAPCGRSRNKKVRDTGTNGITAGVQAGFQVSLGPGGMTLSLR